MKQVTIAIGLVLLGLLAKPQLALAQASAEVIRGSWEGLKALPPGDELAVNLRNGQTVKGRFTSVSDAALSLAKGQTTTDISRGDVRRIYRVVSRSAQKATVLGLGIGAGVGGVAGGVAAASGPGEPNEYGWGVLIVGALGAGIGAFTGYLIGSRRQRVLIYETK